MTIDEIRKMAKLSKKDIVIEMKASGDITIYTGNAEVENKKKLTNNELECSAFDLIRMHLKRMI